MLAAQRLASPCGGGNLHGAKLYPHYSTTNAGMSTVLLQASYDPLCRRHWRQEMG